MKKLLTAVFLALTLVAVSVCTTACSQNKLPAPENITIDDSYVLSWEAIEHSHGYIVEVTDSAGATTETEARLTNFNLEKQEVGDYEIRIKAVGDDGYADSLWSEVVYFHKDYENGCIYEKIANGAEYRLTGYGTSSGVVEVGDLYRGKPVTEIGDAAFRNSRAESVIIGNNVRSIGKSAFYNAAQMTSVTIPDSVTYIGPEAFQACFALNNVVIPDSITEIGDNMFNFCRSLTNIQLPAIESIGQYAFANCSLLAEFVVPDSVTSIGMAAFLNDKALESVTIGAGVRTIGDLAFGNAEKLASVKFSDSGALESIGTEAFSNCLSLTSVNFSEGLKSIGSQAFESCALLSSVTFPEGLESIGDSAFRDCAALNEVSVPDSVTRIGQFAFLMTGLYNAAKERGDTYVYADTWLVEIVADKADAIVVAGGENTPANLRNENFVPMRDDITGIADAVFYKNSTVERVFLPDSVIYIGNSAFSSCDKLWYFEASSNSSLRVLDTAAFINCGVLRTIYLGNALEDIGAYAFYECSVLENNSISSIIPESVTHIGMLAFLGTSLYNNVDEYGVVYAGNWVIGYENSNYAIQYFNYMAQGDNKNAMAAYAKLSKVTYIRLENDVKGIADYAFYGHINLEQVDGMSNAEYLGEAAFYACQKLSTVNLNGNLKKIEDYTFYGCESVFRVTLPPMISSIGRSAFYNCEQLSEVNFTGTRLETIDDYAFYKCINLPSMNFGSKLTSVGNLSFAYCSSLQEITLPDTVQSIGVAAFYECTNVKQLTLGQGVEVIGKGAFYNCVSIPSVVIPDSVKTIEDYAFSGCSAVTELDLGNGVESIGNYAFRGLGALQSLVIPSSVRYIGDSAFRYCTMINSVILPGTVEQIGIHAFFEDVSATIYSDGEGVVGSWVEYWNSSYCPVVFGCTFSEDGSYVVSVTVTDSSLLYVDEHNTVKAPQRSGYTFAGWALSADGAVEYTAKEIGNVPSGTTLYAVWQQA